MPRLTAYLLIGSLSFLCACHSFKREVDDQTPVTFVGTSAEHRVAISSLVGPFSRPGLVDPSYITCTEPSPDVAKAVSRAFETALAVDNKGTANLSSSTAVGLAQLAERTASIQLLREKMYQNCLAYKNGAISGVTYTLIMSRLDDSIVTLLLGETAGGAFGRSGAAIATSAAASGEASMPALAAGIEDMDDAVRDVEAARAAIEEKTKQRDAKQKACDDEQAKQAGSDKEKSDTPAEIAACTDANKLSDEILIAQGELKTRIELLRGTLTSATRTAAKTDGVTGVGAINHRPDANIAGILADMQDNFLSYDVSATVIPACLVELGLQNSTPTESASMMDAAYSELARVRSRLDRAHDELAQEYKKRNAAGVQAAQAKIDTLTHQEQTAAVFLTQQSNNVSTASFKSGSAANDGIYGELFHRMLARWDEVKDPAALVEGLQYLAGAANNSRQSRLASYCARNLPLLVDHLGMNAQSLKQARLRMLRDVRIEEIRSRSAEHFNAGMALCAAIPADEQATCRQGVYTAASPGSSRSPDQEEIVRTDSKKQKKNSAKMRAETPPRDLTPKQPVAPKAPIEPVSAASP